MKIKKFLCEKSNLTQRQTSFNSFYYILYCIKKQLFPNEKKENLPQVFHFYPCISQSSFLGDSILSLFHSQSWIKKKRVGQTVRIRFRRPTSAQLSRAVKADEISVVEPTQPLRLARQSKNKKRLGLLSQPLL